MKLLRLPNFSRRLPLELDDDTLVDSAVSLLGLRESEGPGLGVVLSGSPVAGLLSQGRFRFSQVPREPHCAFALLSDPGRTSTPSHCGASVLPPLTKRRRLRRRFISRLNHTALALAVYASCRHHWRLCKTRFRGWPTFPGGIIVHPLSSVGEFRFRIPSPGAYLGAICLHFLSFCSACRDFSDLCVPLREPLRPLR